MLICLRGRRRGPSRSCVAQSRAGRPPRARGTVSAAPPGAYASESAHHRRSPGICMLCAAPCILSSVQKGDHLPRCAGPDRPKWLGPLSEGSVPSYLNGEYAGARRASFCLSHLHPQRRYWAPGDCMQHALRAANLTGVHAAQATMAGTPRVYQRTPRPSPSMPLCFK